MILIQQTHDCWGFPLCSQNADLIFTCDLRLHGLTSPFSSLLQICLFFSFNFLLASCAVCPSFLVLLLVLTRVLHSDLFSPPTPSSLTCLFLFRCSLLCPLHILRPLTKRHASLGRTPIPCLESLPWLPRWILFLVYTVSLFLNGILSICSYSFL